MEGEMERGSERDRCREARLGDNHSKNALYENDLAASMGIFTQMENKPRGQPVPLCRRWLHSQGPRPLWLGHRAAATLPLLPRWETGCQDDRYIKWHDKLQTHS